MDISRDTSGPDAKIWQSNNSDTRTGDILYDNRIMKPGELGKFVKTAKYRLLMPLIDGMPRDVPHKGGPINLSSR
jgi:hypothetical protein